VLKKTIKRFTLSPRIKDVINTAGWPLAATLLGLLFGAIIIMASGFNALRVYGVRFEKSFFDFYYFLQVLTRASPVILCGMAAALSWRAGYINLGMEGQMTAGGFIATVCALFLPGPPWFIVGVSIAAGCLAGALYALVPTILQWKCNVSLIISTLMLNYVATYITSYYVSFPLKDLSGDQIAHQTPLIARNLRFLRFLPPNTFNFGFVIAIASVFVMLFIMKKTVFGYESKMGGLNPNFARYGGIKQVKIMLLTMGLSGALAGLAGCIEVFGARFRFTDGMFANAGYAWTGLMAALIGGFHPIAVFLYSVFLVGLSIGGQALQRTFGLPLQIAYIIQCVITLFVAVRITAGFFKKRKTVNEAGSQT
jgi:simple sugar transport system permease protein